MNGLPYLCRFKNETQMYRIGLDVGSTTIKTIVLDESGRIVYSRYERHHAKIQEKLLALLSDIRTRLGDAEVTLRLTGSVGMGIAERCSLPFVQEVVAATNYIARNHREVSTLIDIGGEDAKVVFLHEGEATDLRMNGNCAGGTGAFIDQMAILLNVTPDELGTLALNATHIYPIASRCGVFSKTDIQNLIAKNACKEDIAASIFHAVAVQVIVTLAHGCDITAPLLFCGGPLTFLPALRKAFTDYLQLSPDEVVLPEDSHLIPAWGSALSEEDSQPVRLSCLSDSINRHLSVTYQPAESLEPIFSDDDDYRRWKERISQSPIREGSLRPGVEEVTLGIDSGSTTTKIVVLNRRNELLYTYYHGNDGNPIATVEKGLRLFRERCEEAGTQIRITGSCSTGYGEDLIKAAFRLNGGIIETIAHYMAARHVTKDVSFILDIGGQDMKAMFVSGGVINRIEINEACSSGCGSFIETFAKSLGLPVQDFAAEACRATRPYDLGTRCTVFMNSKVKQALREGAGLGDIAAGLSYSVVKNCLYKVLRLKSTEELGPHIVVQGGTMKNDSVVRAFEKLIGREVFRSNHPELMGAIGCALYARQYASADATLDEVLGCASYTTRPQNCHGCENQCLITTYRFANGNRYYSGNRCEKVFTNKGMEQRQGQNVYARKEHLLFDRHIEVEHPIAVIGIPRCLNLYEEYPFWHTLLNRCGLRTVLSAPSSFAAYEAKAKLVMSDNICFPAKLAHSHIQDLIDRRVDRIFMPFVVFEKQESGQNSYNCPIVSGYAEVIKSVQRVGVPIDSPTITFKDKDLLYKQCKAYLRTFSIPEKTIRKAFEEALKEADRFEEQLIDANRQVLAAADRQTLTVLLAGRPYHTDPLIQHKLSDMIAAMGVNVLTDDLVRHTSLPMEDVHYLSQWAYPNRILKAAKWVAMQGPHIQCMQMTSFGCGPDALLTDETRDLLKRYGKTLTLLKIDDVSNIGSIKLRVRSTIESLRLSGKEEERPAVRPFVTTPPFREEDRKRKIIAPFFTPFISPLIPPLMKLAGYDVENLPVSDTASCDWGLKYANNEVCYPATLIVGDIVKAFKEGRYDPETTAVAMTQTGGQCRASNYLSLIQRALSESGFGQVPVISLTFGGQLGNEQPGFRVNWFKMLPTILNALLFSDCIAKLYYATIVREKEEGTAVRLKEKYLDIAKRLIENGSTDEWLATLRTAAAEFDAAACDRDVPRVGIVGEIFLKFNPFAQKNICEWLISRRIEVVPPLLTDFFVQGFVNYKVNQDTGLQKKVVPGSLIHWLYKLVWRRMEKFNRAGSRFRHFTPFANVFDESKEASRIISLSAQFGEGWLLPGEILSLARQRVDHVISLQPFGCIANHIVSKGIEKRIKDLYPQMHLLSLDFDSGVSDVNIMNRLLLFTNSLKTEESHASRTDRNIAVR